MTKAVARTRSVLMPAFRLQVVAHRVDLPAQRRPAQQHRRTRYYQGEHGNRQRNQTEQPLRPDLCHTGGELDRRRPGEPQSQPAADPERPQRGHEGNDSQFGDKDGVGEAEQQSYRQADNEGQGHGSMELFDQQSGDRCRKVHVRPDGQIDAGRQQDERHPDGHDADVRGLLDDVLQTPVAEEMRREQTEDDEHQRKEEQRRMP
jgi:hypothetical protein